MTNGERLEAKVDWLIEAVKYLLKQETAEPVDELDEWMDEPDHAVDESEFEHVAVRTRPKPKKPPCPHNRQGLDDDGNVICQRCFTVLTSSGLVHTTLSAKGRVLPDPDPPRWSTERSPGASSKNPGGQLAPHSV